MKKWFFIEKIERKYCGVQIPYNASGLCGELMDRFRNAFLFLTGEIRTDD